MRRIGEQAHRHRLDLLSGARTRGCSVTEIRVVQDQDVYWCSGAEDQKREQDHRPPHLRSAGYCRDEPQSPTPGLAIRTHTAHPDELPIHISGRPFLRLHDPVP